jgi:hypothetical protein
MYKIYCDMDGVITDFIKALTDIGYTIKQLDDTPALVWPAIDRKGVGFWSKMKWTPDGKHLWNYIKKYDPEILSSPSKNEASKTGKRIWVKQELGDDVRINLIYKKQKQKFAAADHILIDDHPDNIARWIDQGGIGIKHTNTEDSIKQLKELGL